MGLHNRKSTEPYIKDEIDYYAHQVEGVRRMIRMNSFLLADDMGLGKSMQSLTVFGVHCAVRKKKYGTDSSALVVCPASVKDNWENEVGVFTRMPAMVVDGSPKKRTEQIAKFKEIEGSKVLVVNYEQVKAHLASINSCNFDVVIADEAHMLKNPEAQRTKAFMNLRAERFFMLTGSPMLNDPSELWTILNTIQPGVYGNYYQFKQRYCRFGGWENKKVVGPKNVNELNQMLNAVMIRRLKDDVLDLPAVQYIKRIVGLKPLQKKLHDQAVKELVLPSSSGDKEIKSDAIKFLRLKQICGTTATVLDDGRDESAKLDLAEEDAENITNDGHKIIVFTQFRGVLEAYRKRLANRLPHVPVFELHGDVPIPLRQSVVNEWSNVKGPSIILCTIRVAGVGLNMTAARHMQFLDEDYVPMMNEQAVSRANRIGASTKHSIQVFRYQVKGSVEERVDQILKVKSNMFENIVEGGDFQKKLFEELKKEMMAQASAA